MKKKRRSQEKQHMVEHILDYIWLIKSFLLQDNLRPTGFTKFVELYNKLPLTPVLYTFHS